MLNVEWSGNWLDASKRESPISPYSFFLTPVFFYVNLLWLMPYFFKRETWYQYIFISFLVFTTPELIRLFYVLLSNDLPLSFSNINRAFWVQDNVLLGAINPVWLGLIPSAGYFLVKSYIINSKRLSDLENQRLRLELSLLKSQINPHFFLNSLNTLDGLIDQDLVKAKIYVQLLGKIYRFILSKGNEDVVTAAEELTFCNDYISLINIRFGDTYIFKHSGNKNLLEKKWLPPAAIQTLLENAVKHNVGTIQNPLIIQIHIEEQCIIVENKKLPKQGSQISTGTGLANLQARYRLLFNEEVIITDENNFKVLLPLIHDLS